MIDHECFDNDVTADVRMRGPDPSGQGSDEFQLPSGTMIRDRYRILRVLGQGGYGITYLALDANLQGPVAIKEYFPRRIVRRDINKSLDVLVRDDSYAEEFRRGKDAILDEAQRLLLMEKEYVVVGVRDFVQENNTVYCAMEFVEGMTLRDFVTQSSRIPVEETLELMRPLFGTLSKMHERGLIHRDIAPDNLMLEDGHIRLIDFGCAWESYGGKEPLPRVKEGYAPIEQYDGSAAKQDAKVDVYGLSASIYFCITGERPPSTLERAVKDTLVPPSKFGVTINQRQEHGLMHGLAVKARNRTRSLAILERELYEEGPDFELIKRLIVITLAILSVVALVVWGIPAIQKWIDEISSRESEQVEKPVTNIDSPVSDHAGTLRADILDATTVDEGETQYCTSFQSAYTREQISSITISSKKPEKPDSKGLDVSQEGDESVLAWFTENAGGRYDLLIAANGMIWAPEQCSGLFSGYVNASNIDLSGLDTRWVKSMDHMFTGCSTLTKLNLGTSFTTEHVETMHSMFRDCKTIEEINVRSFDTSSVTSMQLMFGGCSHLKKLDVRRFETDKVEDMWATFSVCSSLQEINVKNWKTASVKQMGYMFAGCSGLASLDVGGFETTNLVGAREMFANCSGINELNLSTWKLDNLKEYEENRRENTHENMFANTSTDLTVYYPEDDDVWDQLIEQDDFGGSPTFRAIKPTRNPPPIIYMPSGTPILPSNS